MDSANGSDGDLYPFVSKVCDLFDVVVLKYEPIEPSEQNFWIGYDDMAKTPRFPSMVSLDAYCKENMARLEEEAAADNAPIRMFDMPTEEPEAESVGDFLPQGPGPYTVREDQFILDRNGDQVGQVDKSPKGPVHAALFAASWEVLVMLHQYVSTDCCTGHAESDTCRYCASINVIRRAMHQSDEILPLLTWFGKYREQQQVAKTFQSRYESLSKIGRPNDPTH